MNIFKKLLISSTIVSFASPVFSQVDINQKIKSTKAKKILEKEILIAENNFKDSNNTLKITVTGTRNPRPVDTFPGNVEVIDQEELKEKSGFTLRDLTDDIPGVTTEAQKRTGLKGTPNRGNNVNIRGLERNRVLFLIDGIRLPSYFYGSAGSDPYYNMNQGDYVDFNTLKSIEILKGPGSALYGADALAGVVTYSSLKPRDLLKGNDIFKVSLPGSYDSSDSSISQSIQLASKLSDSLSSLIVFTIESGDETQVKADAKFIDDEKFDGKNYYISLTKEFDDFTLVDLIYEQVRRDSEIKASQGSLDAMETKDYANRTITYTKHDSFIKTNRDRISVDYSYENPDNNKLIKSFQGKLYSQYTRKDDDMNRTTSRANFGGPPTVGSSVRDYYLKNDIYGTDFKLTSEPEFANTSHLITYGVDYSKTDTSRLRITDGTKAKDNPDTAITRTGLFLQDEFSYGKFDFILGLRFDNYELDAKNDSVYNKASFVADFSEGSLTPKIASTYNFNSNISGFAQYAQGFRAPAWYEVNSGFDNFRSGYTTESNPSLKPETSDSFEVGLRARYPKFDANLFAFFSKYENFIEQLKKIGTKSVTQGETTKDLNLYKSINADKAEISGIEFSGEYYFQENRRGLSLYSLTAFQEGTNNTTNEPLKTISPFETSIGFRFRSNDKKWSTQFSNKFVGKARAKKGETDFIPDAYSVTNLKSTYTPSETFSLSLGIYNLFDNTYYNYQDVRNKSATTSNITAYTQPGRYIKASFEFKF